LDLNDFTADAGLEFVHMVEVLHNEILTRNIPLTSLTRKELDQAAGFLAISIKKFCKFRAVKNPYSRSKGKVEFEDVAALRNNAVDIVNDLVIQMDEHSIDFAHSSSSQTSAMTGSEVEMTTALRASSSNNPVMPGRFTTKFNPESY